MAFNTGITTVGTGLFQRGVAFATGGGVAYTGGAVSLTSTGKGVTASAIAAVSSATGIWAKGRAQVNAIRSLGNGSEWECLWIDNNGTGGTIGVYIANTGASGPYTISMTYVGQTTLTSGSITLASLPANGQDVVWAGGYAQGNQQVYLFDGLGNVLGSGSAAQYDGAITTGSGYVTVNGGTSAPGTTQASVMDGVAIYSTTTLPTAGTSAWWSKPSSGDANIAYLCYMNDAQSGTTPGTSVAAVGTTGLTWTSGQFSYTTDSTTGTWG